ncbi:MAG: HIT family protein [Phycisphaerales bacterium]|nr:MAG: HIT family protein [Phycisphaerales bacterium]
MSSDNCVFCKIVTGEIPCSRIYENEVVLAFLDVGPISDGHTLVIPKQHFEKLHDCPAELLGQVSRCLGRIARAVVTATDADGYNVLCNNGRAAGQLVDHVHFHIIPRNTGDGVFNRWPSFKYAEGKIEALSKSIRENL